MNIRDVVYRIGEKIKRGGDYSLLKNCHHQWQLRLFDCYNECLECGELALNFVRYLENFEKNLVEKSKEKGKITDYLRVER